MQARLRRLIADYAKVQATFVNHPQIRLLRVEGSPPDKYTFTLNVESLVPAGEDGFTTGSLHHAEIFLPLDYP